jgi:uncharacterized membrane protein
MPSHAERGVLALVLLNVGLQVYDGVATYVGLHVGFAEGNPLLAWAFGHVGTGSALFLFKLQACACVLLLWRLRGHRLATPALALSAAVYVLCSFAPWTAALAVAHLELYMAS